MNTNDELVSKSALNNIDTSGSWDNYKKESEEELRSRLTDTQFKVTQREGTEAPFANKYTDNKREGIYVDVISGVPLFASKDKFDSGTGWPSFTQPLNASVVKEFEDGGFGMRRIEIRGKLSDAHLGHVFNDGPKPTGLRYCMNSASLHFIPKEELEKEGYGQFLRLFK